MHFLPIVERELRRAMRRKSTARWRLLSVAIAGAIGGLSLCIRQLTPTAQIGGEVFVLLTGYTALICFLAGPIFTADCISEERREGTLGLLFLSTLKGYDVVLGKFVSASLSVFYGVLAVQPIMAIPAMMGGVSGNEYWSVSLATLNLLFFSLALGIFVSAASRNPDQPALRTTGLMIFFCVILPLSAWAANSAGFARTKDALELASPMTPLLEGYGVLAAINPWRYWKPLLSTHVLAWIFLVVASVSLALSWKDGTAAARISAGKSLQGIPGPAVLAARARTRASFLRLNPISWLAFISVNMTGAVWLLVSIDVVTSLFTALVLGQVFPFAVATVQWPFQFLFQILVAIQSTRFFMNARRSNALEILLCTPLSARDFVIGQWHAIRRIFLWPVVVLAILQFAASLFMFVQNSHPFALSLDSIIAAFNMVSVLLSAFLFVFHLAAIAWLGMWLAVTLEKPQHATRLTIVALVLAPIVCCLAGFPADLVIFFVARQRIYDALRPPVKYLPLPMPPINPPPLPGQTGIPPVLPR